MTRDDPAREPNPRKLAPLPTWERIAVGAIFGAMFFSGLSCISPFPVFAWISLPMANVLWVLLPAVADSHPLALYAIAEAITGAIIGSVATAVVPLILKRPS